MQTIELNNKIETNHYFKTLENKQSIFIIENKVENPKANILIISPFGKTCHDLFLISHYLIENSFNVFRFDPKNHVGFSSGEMEDFNLSSLEEDLNIAFSTCHFDNSIPIILLSISLSFPVAVKFASYNYSVSGILSLVGAVNPEYTSTKAANIDLNEYRKNKITAPEFQNPFGCKLRAINYVRGLDNGRFSNFSDIVNYTQTIKCPLYMIVSENDEYVDLEDSKKLFKNAQFDSELIVLPNLSHEIGRSLSAAKLAAEQIVNFSKKISNDPNPIFIPKLTELIKKSAIEMDQLNILKLSNNGKNH